MFLLFREAKLADKIDKLSRSGELMVREVENEKTKCACLEKEISWMTEHYQNRQKELEEQLGAANQQRREESAQLTIEKAELMKSLHGYESRMSKLENEILVCKETIARKDVEMSQQVKAAQAERKEFDQEAQELRRKLQRQIEDLLDLNVKYDELESKSKEEVEALSLELREEKQLVVRCSTCSVCDSSQSRSLRLEEQLRDVLPCLNRWTVVDAAPGSHRRRARG